MTRGPNDLRNRPGLTEAEQVIQDVQGVDLDPTDDLEAEILAEFGKLSAWSGIDAAIVKSAVEGCAADPCGVVIVNLAQLRSLFGHLDPAVRRTAIFVALAHEFGHLLQFKHFGVDQTLDHSPRAEMEAHADVIAGSWIAVRIAGQSDDDNNAAFQAGLSLKSDDLDMYPTAYQRGTLMNMGQGTAAGVLIAESMFEDTDYVPFSTKFERQDLDGMLTQVVEQLPFIPESAPPPPRTYSGPGLGMFHRVEGGPEAGEGEPPS